MSNSLELRDTSGRLIARVDPCPAGTNDVQYRSDIAAEYGMEAGDGYFCKIEDGQCVQKYEIPL